MLQQQDHQQEEQRLIDIMGIRPITLVRWMQNKSEPRPYFLRQLLDALPQHRDSLLPLIMKEFPGFSETVEDDLPKEIASSFYRHVLDTYVATAPAMRFWSICPLILQHVLEHLDPDQLDMELLVVCCMPPSGYGNKIHSLREYVALGTPLAEQPGREEFVSGSRIPGRLCRLILSYAVIQDIQQDRSFLPAQKEENERSAAAFPIMLASRIAGCLLVSSALSHYFHQLRVAVLKQYTNLLVLAFQTEDFYDLASIELNMVPAQHIQQSYFATFRQRVADVLAQAKARQQSLTSQQAEQLARQQLEQELLQIPL